MEYETAIFGEGFQFSNFCPEVTYDRFRLFASYLSRYSDQIDRDAAHEELAKGKAVPEDWRWSWQSVSPMHYTECPLYSVLKNRTKGNAPSADLDPWYKRPLGIIAIAVSAAVLAAAAKWVVALLGVNL